MKRLSIFAATLLLLVSCSQQLLEEPMMNAETRNSTETEVLYYIPYQDALAKVKNLFERLEKAQTRTTTIRSVKEHFEFVANPQTRNSEEVEAKFHIINFDDNEGYAVVSADSRTTDIFAYSLSGNLNLEEAIENTGIGIFFEKAIAFYQSEIKNYTLSNPANTRAEIIPLPEPDPIYGDIPTLLVVEYDGGYYHVRYEEPIIVASKSPILNVAWDQCSPYNYYCPAVPNNNIFFDGKAAAGCGPVAMAQIMSYFRQPSSFDWNSILQYPSYYYFDYSASALATANLISTIGLLSNTNYGQTSPTNNSNLALTMMTLGYNLSGPVGYDYLKVMNSLNQNRLVYISGVSSITDKGHAWVVDGYRHERMDMTYYYTYAPYEVYDRETKYNKFCHCNWGGNQNYNGWYVDVFYISSELGFYDNDLKIIHNIRPNQ